MSWSELFPEGRVLTYEGDDPVNFVKEIKKRFGFNPADRHVNFATLTYDDGAKSTWNERDCYTFHCPSEYLDFIYGTGRYPVGS